MSTLDDLVGAIRELAGVSPDLTLEQAAGVLSVLARQAGGVRVVFKDSSGDPLPPETDLGTALNQAALIGIDVPWQAVSPPLAHDTLDTTNAARDRFIVEFDRLERVNSFMAAGYVKDVLIPQVGISPAEAKQFLSALVASGIVQTTQVPSRKNPEFKATRVQLNRDHAIVRRVLGHSKPAEFRPIRIPGGPLSEDIIRDRR